MDDSVRLGIIHLSDIHFKAGAGEVESLAGAVAGAAANVARESELLLVLCSGDIAFSGRAEEYDVASTFFQTLRADLELQLDASQLHFVVVPGNHDCDHSLSNQLRDIVLGSIQDNLDKPIGADVVEAATKVQEPYFEFAKTYASPLQVDSQPLWTELEAGVGGFKVRLSGINSAWMSSMRERQGALVFPVEQFRTTLRAPCDLRIVLMHHPLNWFSQSSYHKLRQELREHATIVLTGHEHTQSNYLTSSAQWAGLSFEAAPLEGHSVADEGGFSVLSIELKERLISLQKYAINDGKARRIEEEQHIPLPSELPSAPSRRVHPDFEKFFDSGVAQFKHPDKAFLKGDDLFVYPELYPVSSSIEEQTTPVSADEVFANTNIDHLLLRGGGQTGKSYLLQKFFFDAIESGDFPLYLSAVDIRRAQDKQIQKVIERAAAGQYVEPNDFVQAPLARRIVLLDDFDQLPKGGANRAGILSFLEKQFGRVVLSALDDIEVDELLDPNFAEALDDFVSYELRFFGHVMRQRLVQRWHRCGPVETRQELDALTHQSEVLLNSMIGNNLAPSSPIYLLVILQNAWQQSREDFSRANLSHYYQFLITQGLGEAGVPADSLEPIFFYVSQLAWFCSTQPHNRWEERELRGFNNVFSKEFTTVEFKERLQLLQNARILRRDGECYVFCYPYVYYFFLGHYLSRNIDKEEVRELIAKHCNQLERRDSANTILFLTHHTKATWIIDAIRETANACFKGQPEVTFEDDVAQLNELVETVTERVIQDLDVDRNQMEHRRYKDSHADTDDDPSTESEEEISAVISEITRLIRTTEVLGEVTKNYYGSIPRVQKESYISAVYGGMLRLVRLLFQQVFEDPTIIAHAIVKRHNEKKGAGTKLTDARAKQLTFELVGWICAGLLRKAAMCVSADELLEDIEKVVKDANNNAHQLIGFATRLSKPGNQPVEAMRRFAAENKRNIFAQTVLQIEIFTHLHLYHMSDSAKQQLCAIANISMETARGVDVQTRKTRLTR